MRDDIFSELKNEGKSENEAVGTVIAEFGNLDELAEDLGIKQFVHQPRQEQTPNAVSLSMEDVRQFLREHSRHSYLVALSVFLFILSDVCFHSHRCGHACLFECMHGALETLRGRKFRY